MIQKIKSNNKTAKVWIDDLKKVEKDTIDQITLMLRLPKLYQHIAIMPDTHLGKGAVVGGVVATDGIIVPNIVGVDIGCGMCAINTNIKLDKTFMDRIFWLDWKSRVNRKVPVGYDEFKTSQELGKLDIKLHAIPLQYLIDKKAIKQLGTLGGGNHFMEAQVDEAGYIWFMVHSGSRHTGLQIAEYYNRMAKEQNLKFKDETPLNLWFLRLDEKLGQDYLYDMTWAINYALENRWRMLEAMVESFCQVLQTKGSDLGLNVNVRKDGINIHHNFASIENHFGNKVVVHRKGATQAFNKQLGIIPGSMGSPSYIIEGKGNEDSYSSCSHGAGRLMSRTQAKKLINQESFSQSISNTFTKASSKYIDEAPGAYKNIDEVMDNQSDLVTILHKLTPIITIKGG